MKKLYRINVLGISDGCRTMTICFDMRAVAYYEWCDPNMIWWSVLRGETTNSFDAHIVSTTDVIFDNECLHLSLLSMIYSLLSHMAILTTPPVTSPDTLWHVCAHRCICRWTKTNARKESASCSLCSRSMQPLP